MSSWYQNRNNRLTSVPVLRSSSTSAAGSRDNLMDQGTRPKYQINLPSKETTSGPPNSLFSSIFGTENQNVIVTHAWVSFQYWLCGGSKSNRIVMLGLLVSSLVGMIYMSWSLFSDMNQSISTPRSNVPISNHSSGYSNPEDNLLNLKMDRFHDTYSSRLASKRFAIVIDAGSSGSRVYVYSWINEGDSSGSKSALPMIVQGDSSDKPFQLKSQPGLSSFESNIKGVAGHLRPLLDFAADLVPQNLHIQTPIFLYATAGMRLLNSSTQYQIVNEACQFARSNYKFETSGGCFQHFRIISGQLEGILGWLSVNYLKGSLNPSPHNVELPDTYGFLDMGGASFQIAFSPTSSMAQRHADDLKSLTLRFHGGKERVFSLFVTSFLGFGANEAYNRYRQYLLQTATVTSPNAEIKDPCIPQGYKFPASSISESLPIRGTGSFDACRVSVLPLLNKSISCPETPCLFNGVHAPIVDFSNHHFIGVSEFWYSTWSVFDDGGVYDYQKILSDARAFCNFTWDTMVEKMAHDQVAHVDQEDRLLTQCFKSAWIMSVLHEGLNMRTKEDSSSSDDKRPLFESLNELRGYELSWTLGVVLLLASSSIPGNASSTMTVAPALSKSPSILAALCLSLSILAFMAVVIWLFASNTSWKRRSSLAYSNIIDVSSRFGDDGTSQNELGIRVA